MSVALPLADPALTEKDRVHEMDVYDRTPNFSSVPSINGSLEKGHEPAAAPASPRDIHGWKWVLAIVSILSSAFLFALDNSIVADIQPAIVARFGDIEKLPWLSVTFNLGAAATTLVWGKLFGQFNAKWLYIISVLLFEIGSAVCGAANSMDVLIVGRAIAGVGGVGSYVGVLTLLSVTTTVQERPVYLATTGLVWGTGSVLGPVIGGSFADSSATWRWSFINLVIAGIFAPVYLFLLPSFDPRPGVSRKTRLAQIDYAGAVLIVGACTSGIMAIAFGGVIFPWDAPKTIAMFVLSGVLFILFGFQQVYTIFTTIDNRLFPVHFFKDRTLFIFFVQAFISGAPAFIPIYFIPLYFQFVKQDTALDAAVRLLPFMFLLVFFCLLNGAVMAKEGHYLPWYIFASTFMVIGSALMYTVKENTSTGAIYGYSAILAIGAGCVAQSSVSCVQASVSPEELPLAVAYTNIAQIGGITVSLTVANSIFLNLATSKIGGILVGVDRATVQSTITGRGSEYLRSLSEEVQAQVLHSVVDSIGKTYAVAVAAGAVGLILSFGMKWERLFTQMA
ncbi:MAG: hypothetical protein M1817_000808 [Caeruleum heppii]|nr:MAG: hypothetical protein M1817_000808 [Caeruleum heppii]